MTTIMIADAGIGGLSAAHCLHDLGLGDARDGIAIPRPATSTTPAGRAARRWIALPLLRAFTMPDMNLAAIIEASETVIEDLISAEEPEQAAAGCRDVAGLRKRTL